MGTKFLKMVKWMLLAAGLYACIQSADDLVADVKAVMRECRADQTNYPFTRASKTRPLHFCKI
jgi:hypothetical protein